jgi:cysteinyl-tRNA synthetase
MHDGEMALEKSFMDRFEVAMNDDLNTPEALSVMHDTASALNKESDLQRRRLLADTLRAMGLRLGILQRDAEAVLQGQAAGVQSDLGPTTAEIETLIERRNVARSNKDFALSDSIRDQLAAMGIVLEDAGGKTTWRRQ